MFRIDFNSATRVANKLRKTARNTPRLTDATTRKHAQVMRSKLKSKPYVARMTNQKYQRTGNLANRWRVDKLRQGRYNVGNSAPYALRVVGVVTGVKNTGKAWMHQAAYRTPRGSSQWWDAVDVVRPYNKDLTRKLTADIMKEFN